MGSLNFHGSNIELVIFKGGKKYTQDDYPEFWRSISSVRAEVGGVNVATVHIKLTPNLIDALKILGSGLIGSGLGPDVNLPTGKEAASVGGAAITSDDNKTTGGLSTFNYYAVRFFYLNGDSTPFYGGNTCQPQFTLGSEIDIDITINGQHSLMAIGGGPFRFENESALDVLKKLATPFGVEITFDDGDVATEKKLSDAKISGSYNEDIEGVVRRILHDLGCSYVKYNGDGAHPKPQYKIKHMDVLAQQAPEYTFVMYRQISPDDGIIPIEELRLESNGNLFLAGHLFGTFTKGVNSKTKEITSVASTANDVNNAGTKSDSGAMPLDTGDGSSVGGATGLVDATAQIAGHHGPGLLRGDASTMNRAKSKAEQDRLSGLTFHITTPGLPLLHAQSTAYLAIGDGKNGLEAFCGPIWVESLVHSWDSGGWKTECVGRKGAGPIYNPNVTSPKASAPQAPSGMTEVKPKPV